MPYAKQLRDLLARIADCDDPELRRDLIRQYGIVLEKRFTQINSRHAAVIGNVENTLTDMIADLRQLITSGHVTLMNEVRENRQATSVKTHQLSNYVMALENKLDELAQFVLLKHDEQ